MVFTEIFVKFKEFWTNTYKSLNNLQSIILLSQHNKLFSNMNERTASETEYSWGEKTKNWEAVRWNREEWRVARMWDRRGAYRVLVGRLMERDHFEDLDVNWIMLKWIYKKWDREARIGLILLRTGTVGGACESSNELSGYKKCGKFLDWLRTC